MASVAILILNYNGAHHLERFLPSIISNSADCDVIVGDNGSTDNSVDLLTNNFPEVTIMELGHNYGYAEGYNQLINKVSNDYIAIINSDVEVTANWTGPLVAELELDEMVAAVQPKILSLLDKTKFEYAGAAGGFLDKYGYPFCRGRIFDTTETDTGQYNDSCDVFWASGACFLIKRSAFVELQGFDKDFFAHMEEIDLCWRLKNIGYKIRYTSKSSVYHLGGGTLSYQSSRKTYLNFRNSWLMMLKNLDGKRINRTMIIRWLLDMLSVLYFIFSFRFASAITIFKAHFYLLANRRNISTKRLTNSSLRENNITVDLASYSVVKQYYLKKKRKYSSLIPN